LRQNGSAELLCPDGVPRHHVKHIRKRKQGQYAGVPRQIVFLNGPSQRVPGQIPVLISPRRSLGDLVPIRRSGQNLRKQRIGIQRDSCN
jgi:hypothetical protein